MKTFVKTDGTQNFSNKCDGLYADVRITKDKKIIIFEHRNFKNKYVEHLTLTELRQLTKYQVPELDTVLQSTDIKLWNLNIRQKHVLYKLLPIILRHKIKDFILTTFYHWWVSKMRHKIGDLAKIGGIYSHAPECVFDAGYLSDADVLVYNFENADERSLTCAKRSGIMVGMYGIETKSELSWAEEQGVDFVYP